MVILDVREKEEFQAQSIPGSICCPLSQFDVMAPGILPLIKDEEVVVMCRSGKRASMALESLKKMDQNHHRFSVYPGGILQWKAEGKEVVGSDSVFPIMRQVQIVASSMILIAFVLAHYVSPNGIYLALLVGFGLAMAGWTGFCPMVLILQRMPWNKKGLSTCSTNSSKTSCCG